MQLEKVSMSLPLMKVVENISPTHLFLQTSKQLHLPYCINSDAHSKVWKSLQNLRQNASRELCIKEFGVCLTGFFTLSSLKFYSTLNSLCYVSCSEFFVWILIFHHLSSLKLSYFSVYCSSCVVRNLEFWITQEPFVILIHLHHKVHCWHCQFSILCKLHHQHKFYGFWRSCMKQVQYHDTLCTCHKHQQFNSQLIYTVNCWICVEVELMCLIWFKSQILLNASWLFPMNSFTLERHLMAEKLQLSVDWNDDRA